MKATLELFESVLASDFPALPGEARAAYRSTWSRDGLTARCDESECVDLVAVDASAEPRGLVFGAAPEGGVGTIIWLLVARAWRGRGVGGLLLNEACAQYSALGCHKLKLTAPSEAARRFYEREGMTVEGFHPNHWWGCNFWSLGLSLNGTDR